MSFSRLRLETTPKSNSCALPRRIVAEPRRARRETIHASLLAAGAVSWVPGRALDEYGSPADTDGGDRWRHARPSMGDANRPGPQASRHSYARSGSAQRERQRRRTPFGSSCSARNSASCRRASREPLCRLPRELFMLCTATGSDGFLFTSSASSSRLRCASASIRCRSSSWRFSSAPLAALPLRFRLLCAFRSRFSCLTAWLRLASMRCRSSSCSFSSASASLRFRSASASSRLRRASLRASAFLFLAPTPASASRAGVSSPRACAWPSFEALRSSFLALALGFGFGRLRSSSSRLRLAWLRALAFFFFALALGPQLRGACVLLLALALGLSFEAPAFFFFALAFGFGFKALAFFFFTLAFGFGFEALASSSSRLLWPRLEAPAFFFFRLRLASPRGASVLLPRACAWLRLRRVCA